MTIEYITALGTLIGIFTSVLFARRAKKAEVRAREIENARGNINNADLMIELVKKANAEAVEIQQHIINELKKENDNIKKIVSRLEKALKSINRCTYRTDCPVYPELQRDNTTDDSFISKD